MSATKEEIARRIRDRREYLQRTRGGYQQKDIAAAVGIGRTGYNHYESGKNDITAPMLARIARALDVPVSYLIGEMEDEILDEYEVGVWYRGTAPALRDTARTVLKALYDASDAVDRAGVLGGRRVTDDDEDELEAAVEDFQAVADDEEVSSRKRAV